VPPFFANLLPEGPLRDYLVDQADVKPHNEFSLLWALGGDLPGALSPKSAGDEPWLMEEEARLLHAPWHRICRRAASKSTVGLSPRVCLAFNHPSL
jgi:hypothetical protein